MNQLHEWIKNTDNEAILHYCINLSNDERYKTIEDLKRIDINKDILDSQIPILARSDYYEKRANYFDCINFALVACTRNYADVKKLETQHNYGISSPMHNFLSTGNYVLLIEFYSAFPPDYLNRIVKEISKTRFAHFNFKTLWKLYEKQWVDFEEDFFVRSLFTLAGFENDHFEDSSFLINHSELITSVFLKFYKHEIPVLDLIKCKSIDYSNGLSAKASVYWTEVFKILVEKNAIPDRTIVSHLLESLLNNWKKPHLDWHIRLLDLLNPTQHELLENQTTFFSVLGTNQPSLINYALQNIKAISTSGDFDQEGFASNFPLVFSNEKCAKAISIGLDILDTILAKRSAESSNYSEQLAVLLMQTDVKLQENTASLLVKYFNDNTLRSTITPYQPYLKQKTKTILSAFEESESIEQSIVAQTEKLFPATHIAKTWDELLFQIGNCIRTKSSLNIDLFFEGLNQLQNQIPSDFEKQLKPYTKQLFNKFWENSVMALFSAFIEAWITGGELRPANKSYHPIPFLWNKSEFLLRKLRSKNDLPFLSTPTHEPMYIHPEVVIEKLLQYEERNIPVHLEDLIVACNRMLLYKVDGVTRKKVMLLKGLYARAIQYYMGAIDKIVLNNTMLPLWAQVVRLKNPARVNHEFKNTTAESYPAVIKPFEGDFKIVVNASQYATWYRLIVADNWNYSYIQKEKSILRDSLYYNAALTDRASRLDIPYQLSLNPNYLDALLCRYIPNTATGNEVRGFEKCLYPMQFIVENNLPVYYGGWLYVAVCLLFEKKISRDLASEYIQLAIERGNDLLRCADMISILIAQKYAPVNRLLEYLDKPSSCKQVKLFQLKILENCVIQFNAESLPVNSKKIVSYLYEWCDVLQTDIPAEVQTKLSKLKK